MMRFGSELREERADVQRDDHPEGDRDEDHGDGGDLDQEPDLVYELAPRPGPAEQDMKRLETDGEHLSRLAHPFEESSLEDSRGLSPCHPGCQLQNVPSSIFRLRPRAGGHLPNWTGGLHLRHAPWNSRLTPYNSLARGPSPATLGEKAAFVPLESLSPRLGAPGYRTQGGKRKEPGKFPRLLDCVLTVLAARYRLEY